MKRKTFKQLGTLTKQAQEAAEDLTDISEEELRAMAQKEHERLKAAGEIDRTEDMQPDTAPPWDSLNNVMLEINWRYWVQLPNGRRKGELCWCEGRVVDVASAAASQIPAKIRKDLEAKPKYRAVRVCWPADPERNEKETLVWSIIKPEDWKSQKRHLGWRFAPCELAKLRAMDRQKK
jgi:hypothetical protein